MGFTLHHVGIAVPDLEPAVERYARLYGYEIRSDVIEDPVQTARVQFLSLEGERVLLELVSPLGPDSKLQGALAAGRRLNHVCYAVEDLAGECARLREDGLFLLQEPVVAVAFHPRRIAWLMDRDGIPVELVERGEDSWARRP